MSLSTRPFVRRFLRAVSSTVEVPAHIQGTSVEDVSIRADEQRRQWSETGAANHSRANVPHGRRIHPPLENERVPLSSLAHVINRIHIEDFVRRARCDVVSAGRWIRHDMPAGIATQVRRPIIEGNYPQIAIRVVTVEGVPWRNTQVRRCAEVLTLPLHTDDEGGEAVPHRRRPLPVLEIRDAHVLPGEVVPPRVLVRERRVDKAVATIRLQIRCGREERAIQGDAGKSCDTGGATDQCGGFQPVAPRPLLRGTNIFPNSSADPRGRGGTKVPHSFSCLLSSMCGMYRPRGGVVSPST